MFGSPCATRVAHYFIRLLRVFCAVWHWEDLGAVGFQVEPPWIGLVWTGTSHGWLIKVCSLGRQSWSLCLLAPRAWWPVVHWAFCCLSFNGSIFFGDFPASAFLSDQTVQASFWSLPGQCVNVVWCSCYGWLGYIVRWLVIFACYFSYPTICLFYKSTFVQCILLYWMSLM